MNRELSREEIIERTRIAVTEVFGYASISLTEAQNHEIDVESLVNENDWTLVKGSMGYAILIEKSKPDLVFGDRPDNKTLRRMAKEQKNAQKSES